MQTIFMIKKVFIPKALEQIANIFLPSALQSIKPAYPIMHAESSIYSQTLFTRINTDRFTGFGRDVLRLIILKIAILLQVYTDTNGFFYNIPNINSTCSFLNPKYRNYCK